MEYRNRRTRFYFTDHIHEEKHTHTYTKKECTVLVNTIHFKNARELLQNCQADVKAVTSELNVKGKLWKLTHLKISSVTSAPLGLSDRAVVCRPEKKKKAVVQHFRWTAPLLRAVVAICATEIGLM